MVQMKRSRSSRRIELHGLDSVPPLPVMIDHPERSRLVRVIEHRLLSPEGDLERAIQPLLAGRIDLNRRSDHPHIVRDIPRHFSRRHEPDFCRSLERSFGHSDRDRMLRDAAERHALPVRRSGDRSRNGCHILPLREIALADRSAVSGSGSLLLSEKHERRAGHDKDHGRAERQFHTVHRTRVFRG